MSATERTIGKFIAEEVLQGAGKGELDPQRPILEEGILDSLALQKLLAFVETEFGLQIVDDQLQPGNFESIRSIASLIDRLKE